MFFRNSPLLLATSIPVRGQTPPKREIAITIDDLPAGAANSMTGTEIVEMTTKLLNTLRDRKVPAVGFVNEQKLYKLGEVDDRIKALNLWPTTASNWAITPSPTLL